jgi:hypothetical protein
VSDYTLEARVALWRASGASLLGDCMPLIANMNAVSPIPTEMLADALLSIVNDWWMMPARWPCILVCRLEAANAAIIDQHRTAAEAEAAAAARPRGMSKPKRTHKSGR